MEQLIKFKQELAGKGIEGVALDIDETISWTVFNWMSDMQTKFGNPEGLTTEELIMRYKLVQYVPYWSDNPEAKIWISEQRQSHEAHFNAPLITNADHYVNKIHQLKPIVAYITSRTESLRDTTITWLDKHQFPKVPIIMKPSDRPLDDVNEWKAKVLDFLYPQIQGIVDDNQELPLHLPPTYRGTVYYFGHSTPPESCPVKVIPCPAWEDVYEAIKQSK